MPGFRFRGPIVGLSLVPLLPAAAFAAAAAGAGANGADRAEVTFIAQVILLLLCGRLLGELMQRVGQPAVTGQLLAGILLGPSVFGALWPGLQHAVFPSGDGQNRIIEVVSRFGILLLLLLTGMDTDLAMVKTVRRAAFTVSLTGIALPFAGGFLLGQFLPDALLPDPGRRLITSLFLGTALAISSVKIVAVIVRDMGFARRLVGQVIVASAIIDDTMGWIIIAITFGLARSGGLDIVAVGMTVAGTLVFLLASFTVGPRLVFLSIRWVNDTLLMELPVISAVLVFMGLMALLTDAIGVNTFLGAFVAGILVGQSPILTKHIEEHLRGLIVALFMPIFFGVAGLHTDLAILLHGPTLMLALGMIAIASLGKFAGALMGGAAGGMTFRESLGLACGMNARGSTEVIVATLGVTAGVLNERLFSTIVVMAIVTTLAMPPMLRFALSHVPLRHDERRRLDREATESRGFVSHLERLLMAVDEGPNGRLASRLVGLLVGSRRIVTTVLPVDDTVAAEAAGAETVRAFGARAETPEGQPDDAQKVDVDTVRPTAPVEEVVPEQARKGYDLMVIGVAPARENKGFSDRVTRLALSFDGPFAIVVARGQHETDPHRAERDILAPITGTDYSRHGAEVALALARAGGASVTALYVESQAAGGARNADAILREIAVLGEQLGVAVNRLVRFGAPEVEIPRRLLSGQHDLVVMGVSRRPGDTLFFGGVPNAVLDRGGPSVLLVASQG